MKSQDKMIQRKFTLIEIMIVLALSTLIVSSLFGVFSTVSRMYQNAAANLYLMHQARLVRGRLLTGYPELGLIEAHANDVSVDQANNTIEYTTSTNTNNTFEEVTFKLNFSPSLTNTGTISNQQTTDLDQQEPSTNLMRSSYSLSNFTGLDQDTLSDDYPYISFNIVLKHTFGSDDYVYLQKIKVPFRNVQTKK